MFFEFVKTAVLFFAERSSPLALGVVMPSYTPSRLKTVWTSCVVQDEAAAGCSKTKSLPALYWRMQSSSVNLRCMSALKLLRDCGLV